MMGIAACLFHWTPATFWKATPHEWWGCFEAHQDMHKRDDDQP